MANQEKFFVEYGVDTDSTSSFKVPAGTTAQRDASPESGLFRYNTSNNQFEGYSNGSWGAIGGGSSLGQSFDVDTFTGDNSTTAFTLGRSVSSEDYLIVFIDGVFQAQDAYTLSGTTLTLDSPPATGSSIIAYSVVPISVAEIPADTDDLTEGSTNLYFTNARVDSRLSSGSVATIETSGNVTVGGDLSVSGGLTVSGTTTTVNSTTTSVTDSMIELANSNTSSDVIDIGIYGNYDDGLSEGGVSEYTGLFRDASDSTWKLFDGLEEEPTTTVNTAGTNYAKAALEVGDLDATTILTTDINLENTGGNAVLDIIASNTGLSRVNLGDTDGSTRGGLKYDHSDDSMVFRANGSDQMTLTNTGLGIGTNDPDSSLHISSAGGTELHIQEETAGQSAQIKLTNTARSWVVGADQSPDIFHINPEGSQGTGISIDSSGNCGIGTTSPDSLLEVEGANATGDAVRFGTSSNDNQGNFKLALQTNDANRVEFLASRKDSTGGSLDIYTRAVGGTLTNALTIDESQNVGIGTTSPQNALHVAAGSPSIRIEDTDGGYGLVSGLNGNIRLRADEGNTEAASFVGFEIDGTEEMRLTSTGLGIGRDSPTATLDVNGSMKVDNIQLQDSSALGIGTVAASSSVGHTASTNEGIFWHTSTAGYGVYRTSGSWTGPDYQQLQLTWDTGIILDGGASYGQSGVIFKNNGTEAMRLGSGGTLLVNTTSTTGAPTGTKLIVEGGSGSGAGAVYIRGDGGGADKPLIVTNASNVEQFFVLGDGDVANTNNSYGAISDQSLKENIVDATDKLADLNQVQVRNFNLIGSDQKQIGVVAQELESVFPALVKTDDSGIKSVKYSVFVPILIKAVQEQQTIIDDLKARIETLENA